MSLKKSWVDPWEIFFANIVGSSELIILFPDKRGSVGPLRKIMY